MAKGKSSLSGKGEELAQWQRDRVSSQWQRGRVSLVAKRKS